MYTSYIYTQINMHTSYYVYLIEVEDELKLILSENSEQVVLRLHKDVYGDEVNIMWCLRISSFTKNFVETLIQNYQ